MGRTAFTEHQCLYKGALYIKQGTNNKEFGGLGACNKTAGLSVLTYCLHKQKWESHEKDHLGWTRLRHTHGDSHHILHYKCTGLFTSPSGISELDCATTKKDTAERSISIGRESLQVFFVLGDLAYFQVPPLGGSREEKWRSQ